MLEVIEKIPDSQSPPRVKVGDYISEKDYWDYYYLSKEGRYEWNNGILEEKPMADFLCAFLYKWYFGILSEYLRVKKIKNLSCLEIGFRMRLPHKIAIRKPDLGVILPSNSVQPNELDCSYRGIFDVCIEFLSDSDIKQVERDTVVKKAEYEVSGVKEYHILDRKGEHTAFYFLNEKNIYEPIQYSSDGILRSKVLQGFQLRMEHLNTMPEIDNLIDDPVYQSYFAPEWQKDREQARLEFARAEQEFIRAEQEKKAKELERLRAEKESKRAEKESKRAEKESKRAEKEFKRAEKEKKAKEKESKRAENAEKELLNLKESLGII